MPNYAIKLSQLIGMQDTICSMSELEETQRRLAAEKTGETPPMNMTRAAQTMTLSTFLLAIAERLDQSNFDLEDPSHN